MSEEVFGEITIKNEIEVRVEGLGIIGIRQDNGVITLRKEDKQVAGNELIGLIERLKGLSPEITREWVEGVGEIETQDGHLLVLKFHSSAAKEAYLNR